MHAAVAPFLDISMIAGLSHFPPGLVPGLSDSLMDPAVALSAFGSECDANGSHVTCLRGIPRMGVILFTLG